MNQTPTKAKKEIYNIKEIHVNGTRLAKLEFLTRNKVKATINGDVPQSTILFILEIGCLYQYLF